jgi:hypothetical protein
MRSSALPFALGLTALVAGSPACQDPTEVVLDVHTDVPCTHAATWRGVAISVGQPGADVEGRAPVLTTTACDSAGAIGTLAVVPTGPKDAQIGVRVVAGITRNPEDCPANGYDGCIVARRTIAYLPHRSQHLLIELTSDCIGNACDPNHTCVNGSCTDTVTAKSPTAPDGGPLGGTVRCGDDGTRCPANDPNNACCVAFDLDAGTGKGTCVAAENCPSTSAVLYCDDWRDCEQGDASDPGICCLMTVGDLLDSRLTNAACQPASTCTGVNIGVYSLCQGRRPCPLSGISCEMAGGAPGYFQCKTK